MLEKRLDEILHEAMEREVFPGAVLRIIWKGKEIYTKALGYSTYSRTSPKIVIDTRYDIASVTKIIVATGIFRLIDTCEVTLEDSVESYFPLLKGSYVGSRTIWNLLTHTSDIKVTLSNYSESELNDLETILLHLPMPAESREEVSYANINSYLLGKILSKISSQNLKDFLTEQVLMPLQMYNTKFLPDAHLRMQIPPTELDNDDVVIQGVVHDESARRLGGVVGHAGLFTNVYDLGNFLSMWTNTGTFRNEIILKEHTVREAINNQTQHLNLSSGLGWHLDNPVYLGNYAPQGTFFHPGFTGSLIAGNHERGLHISFLSNRTYPKRKSPDIKNAVFRKVMDEIFLSI